MEFPCPFGFSIRQFQMKLRVKDPATGWQRTLTLDTTPAATTWAQLLCAIAAEADGGATISVVKSAAPPFAAFTVADPEHATLADVGVRHGDSLLVSFSGGVSGDVGAIIPQPKSQSSSSTATSAAMVKHSIADDNSCLFNAIGYVLMDRRLDQSRQLRQLVAETVRRHPDQYSEAVLGQPVDDYCRIITSANSWGGAIELAIFAQHFRTEIVSIDVETCRPYHFGEGAGYQQRVFVLYSGIHYDAVVERQGGGGGGNSAEKTLFDATDDLALIQALSVAEQERRAKRFTNTNTFALRCMDCRTALVGQKEAQEHCRSTGHTNFAEYSED